MYKAHLKNKASFFDKLKKKFLYLFRLTSQPVVKVYHGYGNASQMIVFGHVFSLSPLPRKKYRKNFWTNTFALIRSFMVVSNCRVQMFVWFGVEQYARQLPQKTDFFVLSGSTRNLWPRDVYKIQVQYYSKQTNAVYATGIGSVIIPHINQYSFISDIDDTFLISHSSNLRKRLYVLLTKNAHSRKPFEGVVNHYRLLANAKTNANHPNPFFYVSSSEWNLYDFIKEFTRKNELPEGVFLLSQIKRLAEVWKTGATKHGTKFMRIARIFEAYPTQRFVLLGDDSQQDPVIYSGIVAHFPGRVISVYLRHVYEDNLTNVKEEIKKIESKGVEVCHFVHSSDAIEHSYKIGLLQKMEETKVL